MSNSTVSKTPVHEPKETIGAFILRKIRHYFHVISEIRPLVWICIYLGLMPLFAIIYWLLPDGQFRIPDGSGTDFGSWLYYSIVTITTLGFGDYTPSGGWAQAVTVVEVMLGLAIFGFFLNAVASLKGEVEVESEIERQRLAHEALEKEKLEKNLPVIIHKINLFLSYCYAVTTPLSKRNKSAAQYNPDFTFNDMQDLFKTSGLPSDFSSRPAVESLVRCAQSTSLYIDSLQTKIDLTIWPQLLEDCFAFVAACQMLSFVEDPERSVHASGSHDESALKAEEESISSKIAAWKGKVTAGDDRELTRVVELYHFIKESAAKARNIEVVVTEVASKSENEA